MSTQESRKLVTKELLKMSNKILAKRQTVRIIVI